MESFFVLIKALAFQLAWLGSLAVYLCSSHQVILSDPLNKKWATAIFLFFCSLSIVLLSQIYLVLSAFLLALIIVMLSWIALVLLTPYQKDTPTVIVAGSLFILFSSVLGG